MLRFEVQAAAFSKQNPIAHSAKHDIVLARGDGGELFVGEVLMHVEVQGDMPDDPLSALPRGKKLTTPF